MKGNIAIIGVLLFVLALILFYYTSKKENFEGTVYRLPDNWKNKINIDDFKNESSRFQ